MFLWMIATSVFSHLRHFLLCISRRLRSKTTRSVGPVQMIKLIMINTASRTSVQAEQGGLGATMCTRLDVSVHLLPTVYPRRLLYLSDFRKKRLFATGIHQNRLFLYFPVNKKLAHKAIYSENCPKYIRLKQHCVNCYSLKTHNQPGSFAAV